MPFDQKHDLNHVKEAWTVWVQGGRPDVPNLAMLAEELNIPLSYLYKKTAKWKRELKATLQNTLGKVEQGKRARPKPQSIGSEREGRVNARTPSGLAPVFTDEFRQARDLGKQALTIAMQGLIEEATTGTGASRVSAIRELLDRAGLAKDKERKDEASPYEEEGTEMLKARLKELLGTGILNEAPSKISDPTTLQGSGITHPITPLPSLAQDSLSNDKGADPELGLAPIPESELPRVPKVLIT